MICVDTSVWVAAQRGRVPEVSAELKRILDADLVVLPVVVRMELLAGVAPSQQDRLARDMLSLPLALPMLQTWQRIERWLCESAAQGVRFGLVDSIIAALAAERGAQVWSLDHAFAAMAGLGWIEVYTPA